MFAFYLYFNGVFSFNYDALLSNEVNKHKTKCYLILNIKIHTKCCDLQADDETMIHKNPSRCYTCIITEYHYCYLNLNPS